VTRSRELADFLADLRSLADERLLAAAAACVLDTVGCMVHGARQPWSRAAAAHALRSGGSGDATVIGHGDQTSAAMAAFANGCAAHAFELDDVHEEAISHPGAVVVPAALAMAEELGASGNDLVTAVLVGYEAMGRAGIAVGPAAHMLRGYHPTSMSGVYGSAAAVGCLLGFDATTLNHAFGLAVSMASGTMEFAASGGMAKRLHAGRAAEGGLLAACLAADGVEGADDGLAGRYGFVNAFSDSPRPELLTAELGERWMIDEITVKPYAACSDIHPMIQATQELKREHGFAATDVVRVEADGPTKAAQQNSLDGTVSVMAAQYSGQFNIAAALLADPGDPSTYGEERITDPALAAMQRRVAGLTAAAEFDETYAWKMGGRVRIELADGRTLERTVHGQKGSMHDPLTADELAQKFDLLVGPGAHALRSTLSAITELPVSALSREIEPFCPESDAR